VKAVLDTNVVVSGMFFGGVPGSVLDAWADGLFELVLSPGIIEEYRRTCEHLGSSHPGLTFRGLLIRLIGDATLLPDVASDGAITRDPADDKFMLCARESSPSLPTYTRRATSEQLE